MHTLTAAQWSMLQNVANGKVVPGPTGRTMGHLAYGTSNARGYWMPFTDRDYEDFLVLRAAQLVTERGELTRAGAQWASPK